jgi:hypothetical protein
VEKIWLACGIITSFEPEIRWAKTTFAMSLDESRYTLNGANMR